MDVRHLQYLGTAPMNQLTEVTRAQGRGELRTEIGDISEETVNINETTTESLKETEPAENAENTEKLRSTKMGLEISIFTLAVENLQFNCDQCKRTNSSENGLTQHMWMKQYSSKDFRHIHFDYCSHVYKKYLKDKIKCEKCIKCNMENAPKGHIIQSNQINIWNVS